MILGFSLFVCRTKLSSSSSQYVYTIDGDCSDNSGHQLVSSFTRKSCMYVHVAHSVLNCIRVANNESSLLPTQIGNTNLVPYVNVMNDVCDTTIIKNTDKTNEKKNSQNRPRGRQGRGGRNERTRLSYPSFKCAKRNGNERVVPSTGH